MHSPLSLHRNSEVELALDAAACGSDVADFLAASAARDDARAAALYGGAFLDGWHDDAANTRPAYFDKIAPQGVYIGTDKSEIWTRDQFKAWAKPFWDRGKAWSFTALRPHLGLSNDADDPCPIS